MKAIRYAREKKVPFFGICLGLQTAVIEYARNVAGLEGANSTEFDEEPRHKVIYKLRDLIGVEALGGTMRLGKYPCELVAGLVRGARLRREPRSGSATATATRSTRSSCRRLKEAGLSFTGMSPDRKFVEIIELHEDHPWFLGCQFHPELKSKPFACHPLFKDFIRAARAHRGRAGRGERGRGRAARSEPASGETRLSAASAPSRSRPATRSAGGAPPALLRRALRHRVARALARHGEASEGDRRGDRRADRLQVLLRQGQPLLEGLVPRPRARGGPRHPRRRSRPRRGCPSSPTSTSRRRRRPRRRSSTSSRSRRSSARQTDLLVAAARDRQARSTSRRGSSWRPTTWRHVVEKCRAAGNENILLCERGTLVRVPQPRRRHALLPDDAGARLPRRLRRDALAAASGRRQGDGRPQAVRARPRARRGRDGLRGRLLPGGPRRPGPRRSRTASTQLDVKMVAGLIRSLLAICARVGKS